MQLCSTDAEKLNIFLLQNLKTLNIKKPKLTAWLRWEETHVSPLYGLVVSVSLCELSDGVVLGELVVSQNDDLMQDAQFFFYKSECWKPLSDEVVG